MLQQIELLLKYQDADMMLDRFEAQLKNSNTRSQLVKVRDYLAKQQDFVQGAEQKTADAQNRINELKKDFDDMSKLLDTMDNEFSTMDQEDVQQVNKYQKNAERMMALSIKKRKEIETISSSILDMEKNMQTVRTNYPKAKKEFDDLKDKYNQEVSDAQADLNELKNKVKELEKGIDLALLDKYKHIKRNKPMPVAKVISGQCSGCNMELPSLVLRKLKESKGTVECENCGRLLFIP